MSDPTHNSSDGVVPYQSGTTRRSSRSAVAAHSALDEQRVVCVAWCGADPGDSRERAVRATDGKEVAGESTHFAINTQQRASSRCGAHLQSRPPTHCESRSNAGHETAPERSGRAMSPGHRCVRGRTTRLQWRPQLNDALFASQDECLTSHPPSLPLAHVPVAGRMRS